MKTHAEARKIASGWRRSPLTGTLTEHLATPVWVRKIVVGPRLQPKLTVGPTDDLQEREADRMADAVMRIPEGRVQRMCSECEEEMQRLPMEEPEEETLRAKEAPGQVPQVTPEIEARIEALRGGGSPLPASERAFFEPRFGSDFAGVQVHTGSGAADLAQRVQARAFTVGRSVVFGQGEYQPGTDTGRKLLAHELTHVLQQRPRSLARQAAPPTASPQTVIANANIRRIGTLLFALSELSDVISAARLGLEPNPYNFTVPAIRNWLFVSPGDAAFLATVEAAQQLFLRNLGLTPRLLYQSNTVRVDPFGNACPPNFAYSRGGIEPIYFCDNFIASGPGCQRDVMIHEHFHLLGLIDLTAVATTAQALANPDSLSQLAAEIADGPHAACCLGSC